MKSIGLSLFGCLTLVALIAMVNNKSPHPMSSWVKLSGSDGRDISVNEKGVFHLVNTAGKLYVYEGPNWKQIGENGGRTCYTENGGVKAKIQDDYLWTYQKHPRGTHENRKWILDWGIPGVGIKQNPKDVAIGTDSVFWIIDYRRKINRWQNYWREEMPGGDGVRIAAGGGQLWLINTQGEIYRYKNVNDFKIGWEQIPGQKGKDITVTNDGQVFMVNLIGRIYQRKDNKWIQLDGSDGYRIAANNGKIALVNTDGEIYTRNY